MEGNCLLAVTSTYGCVRHVHEITTKQSDFESTAIQLNEVEAVQ